MPRLFFGNFDFEHELAATGGTALPSPRPSNPRLPAFRDAGQRSWVWAAIAEAGDLIFTGDTFQPDDLAPLANLGLPVPSFCNSFQELPRGDTWQLVPWGWSPAARQLAEFHGWHDLGPPTEVVRRVNAREFRCCLEQDWKIGLPGMALAGSVAELESALAASGNSLRGWLLKANFGMAGREALRGRGTTLAGPTRAWAEKRLATSGPIIVEPIVERVAEAGIQLEIPPSSPPVLLGITPQLVDGNGVYRGSRFGGPAAELTSWQPAVEIGLRTALELQKLGYFGPLGIDAMKYRDDVTGKIKLRPLQDLNARYTMGRLALGFHRILPDRDSWCGSWLQFGARHLGERGLGAWLATISSTLPRDAVVVPASPDRPKGNSFPAVLVLAPSSTIRQGAESTILNSLGIATLG
jgi:hypothetical protein